MKHYMLSIFLILNSLALFAQSTTVTINTDSDGQKLMVNGEPFIINGMNWDYIPVGQTVATTS